MLRWTSHKSVLGPGRSVEMMIPERIYLRTPTVEENNFMPMKVGSSVHRKMRNLRTGRAVLFTDGGHTRLTRDDFQGSNFAMEVSFIPRDMPDSASLGWFLRQNTSGKDTFIFEFFPGSGYWQIVKTENGVLESDSIWFDTALPQDSMDTIMVIVNGDYLSAFLGGALLGSSQSSLTGAGTMYPTIVFVNNGAELAQVDISNIKFWNLDQ